MMMEGNVLGYICDELSRLGRRNVRIERQLYKQRNWSLLTTIVVGVMVYKFANMDRRIKALEGEKE